MKSVFLLLGLFVFVAVFQVIGPVYIGHFFDLVTNQSRDVRALLASAGIFLTIVATQQLFSFTLNILGAQTGWQAINALRHDLSLHVLTLDFNYILSKSGGEFVERIDNDTSLLSKFFSNSLISLLVNNLFVSAVLVYSLVINVAFGLCLLFFVTFTIVALRYVQKDTSREWTESLEQSTQYFSTIGEYIDGASTLRSFDAKEYMKSRLISITGSWFPPHKHAYLTGYSAENVMIVAFAVASCLLAILGFYYYSRGLLSLGSIFTFYYFLVLFQRPLYQIHSDLKNYFQAIGASNRINQLFILQSSLTYGNRHFKEASNSDIRLAKVSYSYSNENKHALDDVSLVIKSGEITGLFGRTGSGKSTLAKLVARLFDPISGAIKVGEIHLSAFEQSDLRSHVLYVSQSNTSFSFSIRDNLSLFAPFYSDQELLLAIEAVGLQNWYSLAPKGLDSVIGVDCQLSVGEEQLLSIARALLRKPSILILDEVTSNLDAQSEYRVIKHFGELCKGGTTIIIVSHRLSFLTYLDTIIVTENGRVKLQQRRDQIGSLETIRDVLVSEHETK